jgi:hypothetical protein
MGKLPGGPVELRLAATLFLLLLGLANLFGAWEVRNFVSFTPAGVAGAVASSGNAGLDMTSSGHDSHAMTDSGHAGPDMPATGHAGHDMAAGVSEEKPITVETLDKPHHHIDRDLLVQDSHVHIPAYAMTAAFLALIVFGLRLSSRARVALILLVFAAPFVDFVGLWGAHLSSGGGLGWGAVAVAGGALMGLVYVAVLVLTLWQCWFRRQGEIHA